ncbi:MAG: hypothetical protein JXB34_04525 [Bacteroidales bacterium]|nr:hypothetical protein [Bacteroidales bacterium]
MMDFITIPIVVGTITLGIYKLFELFVRRKERLQIIEKLGDKLDASFMQQEQISPIRIFNNFSTGALKAGCLLIGVGLGLLVGFILMKNLYPNLGMMFDYETGAIQIASIVFGASVLLFGGISLLVSFYIEMRFSSKQK